MIRIIDEEPDEPRSEQWERSISNLAGDAISLTAFWDISSVEGAFVGRTKGHFGDLSSVSSGFRP